MEDSQDNAGSAADAECIAVARAVRFDALLHAYRLRLGDTVGRTQLMNEFAKIFPEVRNRTGLFWKKMVHAHDRAYITIEGAEEAERIAVALIEATQHLNAALDPALAKRLIVGVALRKTGSPEEGSPETRETTEAEELTRAGHCGEVHLTEEVYQMLPVEVQRHYGAPAPVGTRPDGSAVFGRKRAVTSGEPVTTERCVMSIDMSRFSAIQTELSCSPDREAVVKLSEQIQRIMIEGFARAGGPSYQDALLDFGGDGGVFILEEPWEAHAAAAAILQRAEEENAKARRSNVASGMRCFRVGIAFGPMKHDVSGNWVGDVISTAKRLESGGPSGEIRMTAEGYLRLPEDVRRRYGGEEVIYGKGHDAPYPARRCKVNERAVWPECGHHDGKPFADPVPNPDFVVTPPKPRPPEECFVISPIDPNNARIAEVFNDVIEPACRQNGFIARRADQIEGENPMQLIAKHLKEAPLAIAYLGQPNPVWNSNVMLEVGFRLATQRPIVLISEPPAPRKDGTIPTFTELLPYHLLHRSVIALPTKASEIAAKVTRAVKNAATGKDGGWMSPHAITEVSFTNIEQDLRFIEVSPAAKELFGEDHFNADGTVDDLRTSIMERVHKSQFSALRKDYRRVLRDIQSRLNGMADEDAPAGVPMARVPLVFRTEADRPGGPRMGYLPVIERFAVHDGVTYVRTMYMKVTRGLKLENGVYVCDV